MTFIATMRPGATGSRSSTIAPRKCVRATLSTETAPPVCSASTSSAAALTSAQAAPSCAPPPRRRGAGRLGRRGAGRCRRCAPAGRCRPSCSSSLTGWAGGVQARGSGRGPALAGRPWGVKCMLAPQIEFGAADSSPVGAIPAGQPTVGSVHGVRQRTRSHSHRPAWSSVQGVEDRSRLAPKLLEAKDAVVRQNSRVDSRSTRRRHGRPQRPRVAHPGAVVTPCLEPRELVAHAPAAPA